MFNQKMRDDLIFDSLDLLVDARPISLAKLTLVDRSTVQIGILSAPSASEPFVRPSTHKLELKTLPKKRQKGDVLALAKIRSEYTFCWDEGIHDFWRFGDFVYFWTITLQLFVFQLPARGSYRVSLSAINLQSKAHRWP